MKESLPFVGHGNRGKKTSMIRLLADGQEYACLLVTARARTARKRRDGGGVCDGLTSSIGVSCSRVLRMCATWDDGSATMTVQSVLAKNAREGLLGAGRRIFWLAPRRTDFPFQSIRSDGRSVGRLVRRSGNTKKQTPEKWGEGRGHTRQKSCTLSPALLQSIHTVVRKYTLRTPSSTSASCSIYHHFRRVSRPSSVAGNASDRRRSTDGRVFQYRRSYSAPRDDFDATATDVRPASRRRLVVIVTPSVTVAVPASGLRRR